MNNSSMEPEDQEMLRISDLYRKKLICTGPKGGRYCLSAGGKKKYM